MSTVARRTIAGPVPFVLMPLFEGIPHHQAAALERGLPTASWPVAGPVPECARTAELLVVRGGVVAVLCATARGRTVAAAVLKAGDVFPPGDGRGIRLAPLENAWISCIPPQAVKTLVDRAPRLGARLLRTLADALIEAGHAAAVVSELRVEDRLLGMLRRLAVREAVVSDRGAEVPLRLSHAQWAALIGASRVAVTAAFLRLRRSGLIDCRGRLIVLSPAVFSADEGALAGQLAPAA